MGINCGMAHQRVRGCFLAALVLLSVTTIAHAGPKLLGEISFPNSGAAEAQDDFMEGVLYLHNFEYSDAAEAFRRAQEIDEDFAMAYWGEAMTYNHPLWFRQARQEALDVLRRLAPTPAARQEKAPTEREKDYLWAVETLYGTIEETKQLPKEARDDAYAEAMRRLHEKYADDYEAATFYGLSILGTAHGGRDFHTYMRAAAELMPVWDANRKHPGAAHYLIHSFDDPVHAPLGLPMARVYSDIAPAAAHAQHMTSHIFVAMGMWDDLVEANKRACEVTDAGLAEEGKPPLVSGHYTYWLLYGYLQQGRLGQAKALLEEAHERVNEKGTSSEQRYFLAERARYVIDTEDWEAAGEYTLPESSELRGHANYVFTSALAALRRGNRATAEEGLESLVPGGAGEIEADEDTVAVLKNELNALLLMDEGKTDEAVKLLREAVALEREMPYSFGPPHIVKPSGELLGETLHAAGRNEEAVEAFEAQLERTPLRTQSLLGLARAAKAAGENGTAAEAYGQLAEIWDHADKHTPGYEEVAGRDSD